jgi:hypothetical protein
MKGRPIYSLPIPTYKRSIDMRQRTGVIENIRTGTFFMVVGVVASAAACYFAWSGNLALAIGLVGVGGILHVAGSAVSFANERLEAMSTEYREREATRDVWESIGRIEERIEEMESKRTAK